MKQVSREMVEEPDQRHPHIDQACILRNEKIRLAILCCSLGALALAFALFFFTSNIFPLFLTMVLTFLCYKRLDSALSKSERRSNIQLHPEVYHHPGRVRSEQ